jgi:hypothetical protein
MAVGLQKVVRRGILPLLKADGDLTALVPSASINPDGVAAWPFIKLHGPTTQQLKAACVNGGLVTWDIHAFAGPRQSGGQDVETAEDHAGSIGAHIERVLADRWIDLEGGARARIRLSDIRLLEDGDADHFHWFAQVNARVLAE